MTTAIEATSGALSTASTTSTQSQAGADATRFGAFLERELAGTLATLRQAEDTAKRGVVGLAGTQQVVEAVTAAELALERIIAVRDRVIAAYQEIMRMPI